LDHLAEKSVQQLSHRSGNEVGSAHSFGRTGDSHTNVPHDAFETGRRLPDAIDELSSLLWTTHIGVEGETSFQGPSGNFSRQQPSNRSRTSVDNSAEQDPMVQKYIHDMGFKKSMATTFMEYVNKYHFFVDEGFDQTAIFNPGDPFPVQFLHSTILAAGSCYTTEPAAASAGNAFANFAERIALECCKKHPSHQVIGGML
jgi:hypothetical protein